MGMGPISAGREKASIGLYRSQHGGQILLIWCKEVFAIFVPVLSGDNPPEKKKSPKRGLGIKIRELKKGRESSMVSSGRILSAGEELTNVN